MPAAPTRNIDRSAMPNRFSARTFATLLVGSALALIVIPAQQISATFAWHLGIDETRHGALEALALFALLAIAFAQRSRGLALVFAAIPVLLFTRRHSVDISILLDLLLFEIVVGLGMLVRRRAGLAPPVHAFDYVHAFVAGLAVWSVCAWTASAIGYGSIQALRWLTLLLAIPVAIGRHSPLPVLLWKAMRTQTTVARLWSAALVAWILVLFARTKTAFGFDSMWYGLQGQHVLAPNDSVFESLGLVSPVHYYPKLHEMVLLPLSGLGVTSVLLGLSILMLVLLLITADAILGQLRAPAASRLPTLVVAATLPALANVSGETKPDVLALLFVMLAMHHAMAFVRSRSIADAAWIVIAGALACRTKLTAIPYVGMRVLATLVASAWQGRVEGAPDVEPAARRFSLVVMAITAPVVVLVFARTLILTGLPTIGPDPLFELWHALGFTLAEPGGTLAWTQSQDWSDVPALFLDWTFRPQNLPHIVITWVGNVWLWLSAAAIAAAALLRARPRCRQPNSRRHSFSSSPASPSRSASATSCEAATATTSCSRCPRQSCSAPPRCSAGSTSRRRSLRWRWFAWPAFPPCRPATASSAARGRRGRVRGTTIGAIVETRARPGSAIALACRTHPHRRSPARNTRTPPRHRGTRTRCPLQPAGALRKPRDDQLLQTRVPSRLDCAAPVHASLRHRLTRHATRGNRHPQRFRPSPRRCDRTHRSHAEREARRGRKLSDVRPHDCGRCGLVDRIGRCPISALAGESIVARPKVPMNEPR